MSAIPKFAFSHMGPVDVRFTDLTEEDALGAYTIWPRLIRIHKDLDADTKLTTYWHESMHLAMRDAGLHNTLKPEVEETICDILGTYLAAAMRAGHIQFNKRKKKS